MHRACLDPRRVAPVLALSALLAAPIGAQRGPRRPFAHDWPQFGSDVASTSAPDFPTGITAANVASLSRRQVRLTGTVDASAIYLHDVAVAGALHDTFFVT